MSLEVVSMQIQVLPQPAKTFTVRLLASILAITLAGGIASASQVKAVSADDSLNLTYSKWFSPSFPTMTGIVGGDIKGTFGGHVISATPSADGHFILLKAEYIVIAGEQSFTAHVEGKQNIETGKAVLHGVVTLGWLTGESVLAKFQAYSSSCPGVPQSTAPCFQGTIRVMGESDHEDS
jgi:hypothetical protein